MDHLNSELSKEKNLRKRAEELADGIKDKINLQSLSQDDVNKLLHNMRVHQIELQLQNEELHAIQNELELSQTKYFELYDMAPVGYITLNDKSIIIEANLTFCELLGCLRQDILNTLFTDLINAEDQEIYNRFNKQVHSSSTIETCELRMLSKGEIQFYANLQTTRFYDKIRKEFLHHVIISDISKIKSQEQLLNKQVHLMQSLINNPKEMIFSLDRDAKYTAFNKNYEEEVKRIGKQQLALGDSIYDHIYTPDMISRLQKTINRVLAGERVIEVVHHKQLQIYYEMDWKPVIDGTLNVVGVTTLVRDITSAKIAEGMISDNSKRVLEQKVMESKLALERSKNELENLSTSVSRNLTDPLHIIDGLAHILIEDYDDVLDSEGKRLLMEIKTNAGKMDEIITSLIHAVRISQSELKAQSLEMNKIISQVWTEVQAETKDTAILNMHDLPNAMADKRLLQLVITNLLSNALKFTKDQPKREIDISGVVQGKFVEYSISDTGIGFNMKFYDQLFKMFQRIHNNKEYEGFGIGLYITQRIIEKHGGKIWATSELGKGATFYFTLPAVK
jgi:PAS domain S-box-containing protein